MKKFWKYIIAAAAVATFVPFTGCSDDDEVDPYSINYVYLRQPTDTYATVEYKANGDFISGLTDPLNLVPVRLTKPAPSDLQVEVVIDPSLVDEYNEANGTDYVMLKGAEVLNPKLTIKRGEYQSTEPISIGFTDHSGFIDATENLILPVVIKSNNAGLTTSKSSRIFLTFTANYEANYYDLAVTTVNKKVITVEDNWQNNAKTINVIDFLKLTYAPYEDVTVNVAINNDKVADYNASTGRSYSAMPDATLESGTLTITPEETGASLTINTGDVSALATGTTFVIPIDVTSVTGAAVEPAEDVATTFYVVLSGAGYELQQVSNVSGYSYNYIATFTCTVNGSDKYESDKWTDILNPDKYSYGYWNPDEEMVIDLGETINLTGFCFDFYSSSRCASTLKMETSADGVNWTSWDMLNVSRKSKLYAQLSTPKQTRYIKFVATMTSSGYYRQMDVEWLRLYYE